MSTALDNLIDDISARVAIQLENRMRVVFAAIVRETEQPIYSEEEGANYLKVSADTLSAWRRRKLITFTRYPLAKLRDKQADDDLGSIIVYRRQDLDAFAEKYLIPAAGEKVVKMRKAG